MYLDFNGTESNSKSIKNKKIASLKNKFKDISNSDIRSENHLSKYYILQDFLLILLHLFY